MFDIRKIQEQVIYGAVKNASNDETAKEIVYGKDETARIENNSTREYMEIKYYRK